MKTLLCFFAVVMLIMAFIASTSANEGDILWTRTYGIGGYDWAEAIITTPDGGFLLAGRGTTSSHADMRAIKINAQGDTIWTRQYGGLSADEVAHDVIITSDGNFVLVGTVQALPNAQTDIYLVKIDSLGNQLWTYTYGGTGDDGGYSVVEASDGGLVMVGFTNTGTAGFSDMYLLKVNSDGSNIEWSRTYGGSGPDLGYSLVKTQQGGYLIAGETGSYSPNFAQDMFLVVTDGTGSATLTNAFGDSVSNIAYDGIQVSEGGYVMTGSSLPATNFGLYSVKVSQSGSQLWSGLWGEQTGAMGNSIIETSDHNYLAVGFEMVAGDRIIYLVKSNSTGGTLLERSYPGTFYDEALDVIQAADGNYYIAGKTSPGSVSFDTYLLCLEGPPTAVRPTPEIYPLALRFYPCSPNPFNGETVLSFELPIASFVRLEVFDVSGSLVGAHGCAPFGGGSTPALQYFSAGTHHLTFDGSNLPSGIYFTKLAAGDYSAVQKLILLK